MGFWDRLKGGKPVAAPKAKRVEPSAPVINKADIWEIHVENKQGNEQPPFLVSAPTVVGALAKSFINVTDSADVVRVTIKRRSVRLVE